MTEYLRIEDVSRITGVPISTLRWWKSQRRGGPPSAKIGRRIVYRSDDVTAWLDSHFDDEP